MAILNRATGWLCAGAAWEKVLKLSFVFQRQSRRMEIKQKRDAHVQGVCGENEYIKVRLSFKVVQQK